MSLATKNVATVLVGSALVLALSFAFVTPAKADLLSDLQAQVQALLAQITALSGGSTPSTGAGCYAFTQTHQQGQSGGEVMWVQKFLNSHGAQIAASGAGSPGNETSYYGGLTKAAVAKWQAANGVSPAAGYWGPVTRAKVAVVCSGSVTPGVPGTPVTGNGLKVMLASDSPSSTALVQGQGIAELAKFTFSNPTGSEVSVTSLGFKRIGASTDSAIDNVYLYQGAKRITDPAGISSSSFNFNDSAGIFKIPAGGSVTVSVRADIDSAANGQQVGTQLVSVGSGATLDSSVVLPVSGAIHLVSSATIATATWGAATPTGGTFAPSTDTTVFQATLTVNNRAVWLKSIQFENRGSSKDADFQNVKLYIKGAQVGGTATLSGDKVVFDLTGSPISLATGGNEVRLVADVVGGSGETFDFQIRRGIDIMLVDSELNQPLAPAAPTAVTANTIEGVSLSVVKANTSPTSNVSVAATNVLWGKFEARGAGDNLKIEQITVDVDTTAGNGMDNVRIMFNGVQVGSTQDVGGASSETGTTFSLGSSMILTAGQVATVEVYGDAKSAAGTNYSNTNTVDVGISIAAADTEGMSSGDSVATAISEVEGNSLTISSSSITGTKASGYGDQTMVAGTNNAKIGSFTLSTGSTEGVNVSTIVLNLSTAESGTITDLMLKDSSTGAQIGTTKSSPSTANTFSTNLAMSASQTKTIDVYANIKSSAGIGTVIAELDDTTGGTGATTGQSVTIGGTDVALQTITIGSGTLTVTRDPGTPVSSNVIAGLTSVHVGKFDFAAVSSSFTIQELKVKVPADAATSVSAITLKYKNSAGVEQTVSQALTLSSGVETHATATFTGLTFYVPQNDSADIDVYVDIPTVSSGAKSGAAISVLLDANEGFKAIDGAGSQDTSLATADVSSVTTGYGTKYVKKTIPVLARLTTGYTANTVSANIGLYRFTVTADAAGSVEWRKISLTVTTSGVVTTGWTLYDVTSSAVAVNSTVANVSGTTLSIYPGTSSTDGDAEQIGASSSKTYELRANTVTGWGDAADSIAISFTEDSSAVSNLTSLTQTGNMIWSDRSANSHTTITSDWTSGYLVKDTDSDTRSCQFGTATICTP
ncbi:hypothetical protein A2765_02755 [Candidatus Kaiserbacteria bacterium RIFCSPHIGHO2_01_FULL_56_24]|uniref:Peptidoglycan binding-like domain-containing protein n=1 Tax=Candidatus Kaiserbacteria bacterium RIFCSPHIGHO2_01_FULL_56_24 TaxID=1798487 RepID=A0A1F6DB00_9BACT|nr:MAG: hypothetical protein A2765_02755 [Candidatus Kaiserbacteria bacterium RIFCSPHIGHO2_01_FULL_56_24]